jgi:hypothetical protein
VPTRKQRRRRQKDRRHEYEYVYVDEDGREVDPAVVEEPLSRNGGRQQAKPQKAGRRPVRQVEPPSWRRVLKRGLLFAPLMFILISFLSPDLTTAQKIQQTAFLLLIFIPFSYVMDSMTFRMLKKRQEKLEGGRSEPDRR